MNVALTMIPASVYQMMRGNIVIVTSLMSIIFLKRRYFRHHWTGISSILFGVILVAMKGFFENKDKDKDHETTNPLGILLVLVAQLFSGGLYIVEEKLLGDYYLDPLKVVGLEGLWGFILMVIILPILQTTNCEEAGPLCYYKKVEDTMRAF